MKRVLTVSFLLWLSVTVAAVVSGKSASGTGHSRSSQGGGETSRPGASGASVWGTVKDAAGKPIDGALVSIRGVDQTFSTSVFTDESGEYVTPPLTARRYRMWAQATGFATARAEITLAGRPASQAFTLNTLDDIAPQLTGTEWLDSLPTASAEDRRMKQILRVMCADCHSTAVIMVNRFDEPGWRVVTRAMADSAHNGWIGQGRGFVFTRVIRYHADEIAAYLAKVRGPGSSPLKLTPRPRPRGAGAQAVITEYDVPIGERRNELAWFDGADWSQGPAVGMHGIVGPHDVIADPGGIAWIFEGRQSFETHRTFVRLDPQTGHVRGYAAVRGDNVVHSEQIEMDKDGNIWFHSAGLMRWTPSTETLTHFPALPGFPNFVNSLDSDSAGRVWSNVFYGSVRLDPTTKKWQLFQSSPPFDGFSYGMAVDADDNGWWSGFTGDAIYKADVKTGKVISIPMRDPEYEARKALMTKADHDFYESIGSVHWGNLTANPVPYANSPRRMSAAKRGTKVWVPNWAGANIAEVDIRTHKVTYHKLPVTGNPYKTDVDAQGNAYASVPLADAMVKLDAKTKTWTVYPFASHGCGPRHISVDRKRNEVWVPCDQSSKVARFQFRTADQIRAQKLAAQGK